MMRPSIGALCVAALMACASVPVMAQRPIETTPAVAKTSPEDIAAGKKLYDATCSKCHGLDGGGGDGPSLQGAPERLGDAEVGSIIRGGIPGTGMNGFGSLNMDETGQVVGYLRTLGRTADMEVAKGDPAKGKEVYESSGCAACHIIDGQGGEVGPELTRVGAMRGPAYLHTQLIAPGTDLPHEAGAMERGRFTQYLFVRVTTKSGHVVEGTRVYEDTFTIELKDVAGRFHSFRKLDLAKLEKLPGKSVMPSFKDTLSSTQLDNLVAYLASLKGTAP
ncbi:MAG TPA: c-type cytochrome [Candidatus Acidoferrales bacterium]|jgi:putative heme-binding domain-containing protein|nr:c-type cytochrome [Candidatus Acidoferrales bacterium]